MKMEKNKEEHCPFCHRNCPLSNPRCKKGKSLAVSKKKAEKKQEKKGMIDVGSTEIKAIESKVTDSEMQLLQLFKDCSFVFPGKKSCNHIKKKGFILKDLLENGSLTLQKLQNDTKLSNSSILEVLNHMKKEGYLLWKKDGSDKKDRIISLTDSGVEAARKKEEIRKEIATDVFSDLEEDEKKELKNILMKLLISWKKQEDEE